MIGMRTIIFSSIVSNLASASKNSSFGAAARHGVLEDVPRVPGHTFSGGRESDRDRGQSSAEDGNFNSGFLEEDNSQYRDRYESEERHHDRDIYDDRGRYDERDRYNDGNRYDDRNRYDVSNRYNERDRYDRENIDDRNNFYNKDRYSPQEGYDNRDRFYDRLVDDRDNWERERYNERDRYGDRERYNHREAFDNRFNNRDRDNNWKRQDGEKENLFPHLSPPCTALLNPLHSALLRDSSSLRVARGRRQSESAIVSGLNSFTVTSCTTAEEGALNLELVFNELTISTGMEGRSLDIDFADRRDDIVLEEGRGRFSLEGRRDRITVQVGHPEEFLYQVQFF